MSQKIINISLLISLLSCISYSQTASLKSFNEIFSSLQDGKRVRLVVHYDKCRLTINGKEEKSPDAVGGMDLNSFEYFAKGSVKNERAFVTSSETILISHPRYGYVYNYIKLRVYDDNEVEIIARYLDPKTFEVKMDESFYSVVSTNNNAVLFYLD